MTKLCSGCGETKSTTDFFPDRRKSGRVRPRCKACEAEYQRTRTPEQKRMYSRNWRDNNPEAALEKHRRQRADRIDTYKADPVKAACRRATRTAIENGTLVRPDKCDRCLRGCVPQSHHEDYAKPLEILWLCATCHGYIHRV